MSDDGLTYADNAELAALAAAGDEDACAALVELNTGLVRSLAMRFAGRGVEMEDLLQLGSMGLFKAARSFDPEKGCAFSTYAVPLILGEIRRYLRDNGQLKVSRQTKRLGAQLLREAEKSLAETGREVRLSELAGRCGVSEEEAADALCAVSPAVSLSEPLGENEEDGTLGALLPTGENETEHLLERLALSEAIGKLPSSARRLLDLRYRRELSQQKTAEILGISQVKVSREEKKILAALRAELSH